MQGWKETGAPAQLTASASSNERLPLRSADGSLSGSWLLAGRAGAAPPFFGIPASAQSGGAGRGRCTGSGPAGHWLAHMCRAPKTQPLHCIAQTHQPPISCTTPRNQRAEPLTRMADVLKAVGLVGVRWRRVGSGAEVSSNREQRRVDALLQQQSERAGSNQMGFGAHQVLRLLGMPPHGFSGRRERGHAPHNSSLPLHALPWLQKQAQGRAVRQGAKHHDGRPSRQHGPPAPAGPRRAACAATS